MNEITFGNCGWMGIILIGAGIKSLYEWILEKKFILEHDLTKDGKWIKKNIRMKQWTYTS